MCATSAAKPDPLERVQEAAAARQAAASAFANALQEARDAGYSSAAIAARAGVTRQRVLQLTHAPSGNAPTVAVLPTFEQRYHVPRSQVWGGSRGRQSGNVHLHVTAPLELGRLRRAAGQSLCGRSGWYEREPTPDERLCPRCEEVAGRLGDVPTVGA